MTYLETLLAVFAWSQVAVAFVVCCGAIAELTLIIERLKR